MLFNVLHDEIVAVDYWIITSSPTAVKIFSIRMPGLPLLCFRSMQFLTESRAVARKPRDAAAVLFGLKFANSIHYKF